uniref:Zgc:194209 n=1 Tax=Lepisosteus oculatus TaxID=7918 RepID=W5NKE3_LEPOC
PPTLQGPLAVNRDLQEGRRIFAGQLKGPESFTADADGRCVASTGWRQGVLWVGNPKHMPLIGLEIHMECLPCGALNSSSSAGSHSGLEHGSRSAQCEYKLICAYYLNGVCVSHLGVDGIPFKFLNGLEISRNGTVFFTDSSSKWGRRHHRYELIAGNLAVRMLAYDPATRRVRAVLDGLYMANGIAFSPEEDYLLIAETSVARILRFWLKGPNAGRTEIFIDNMPGYPDNIRLTDRGTFLVGISTTRFPGFLRPFLDLIGPHPALKRFIAKVREICV